MSTSTGCKTPFIDSYRHEALFYDGEDDFVEQTSAFIRDGNEAGDTTLVAVTGEKIGRLRSELKSDADGVMFVDMEELGRNPARIIPAWQRFLDTNACGDNRVRGVGEPIWAERTRSEVVEAQLHESLLNLAFESAPPWWLLCPYDARHLPQWIIDAAYKTHPFVCVDGAHMANEDYEDVVDDKVFELPLDEPDHVHGEVAFHPEHLTVMRRLVVAHATSCGLSPQRQEELVIAVNELVVNAVQHGTEYNSVRFLQSDGYVICEVNSRGRMTEPLVGRRRPPPDASSGYGLWIANQLCDLLQIRTTENGTVMRALMAIDN